MEPNGGDLPGGTVETIFHAALELSSQDREKYLHSACGTDAELRQRVHSLLQASEAPEGFLPHESAEQPILPVGPPDAPIVGTLERPGDKIGRYKLLQKIGEGGCGVVYMAEQEEPVRRKVALKVIKLGMDTRQVVARFSAERQALALMDHENIAKVLDAGATETGRPFFVMELVRGIKVTDYCDQNRLTTEERLTLFVQVCRAIEHAHQKGIIHRDIKPSNVLVTLHDGVPVPKVIDFGIAKATQGRLTDHTMFTAFEQFMGTPAYMSPEQAEMSGLDVDTRSDIYSLGVLLYELLTGRTPFDAKELLSSGLEAMRQTIREREPARPSTMLSTMLDGELAAAARSRRIDPLKLISSIRGDLEWIVMRCLDKDRTRRYETASSLAADVQRHLQNEPVLARPPSRLYLLQKLVHRHKFWVASAGAVTVAVLLGLTASTWLWIQERKASRIAAAEAVKSKQVADVLSGIFRSVDPSVALGRDTSFLREILSNSVPRITRELGKQRDVEAQLLAIMGSVFSQLADYKQSERLLRRALGLRIDLYGTNHLTVADSCSELAGALWQAGQPQEAEAFQREALRIYDRTPAQEQREIARCLHSLGQMAAGQGRMGDARGFYTRALEIRRVSSGTNSAEFAQSLADVAETMSNGGEWEEAERMYNQALAIYREQYSDIDPTVANLYHNLAKFLVSHDKDGDAEDAIRKALDIRTQLLGSAHPLVAETRATLARVLIEQQRLDEAEKEAWEALNIQKRYRDSQHPGLADTVNLLVNLLSKKHREDEADPIFSGLLNAPGINGSQNAELLKSRGKFRARMMRWDQAAADFRRLIEFDPGDHENYHFLTAVLVQMGDLKGYRRNRESILTRFGGTTNDASIADRMAKDCLILPLPGTNHDVEAGLAEVAIRLDRSRGGQAWFRLCKSLAEYRQGHFKEAIGWAAKVVESNPPNPDRVIETSMIVAMAQYRLNSTEEAKETLAKGLEVSHRNPPDFLRGNDGWMDWVFGQALLREASALISNTPPVRLVP